MTTSIHAAKSLSLICLLTALIAGTASAQAPSPTDTAHAYASTEASAPAQSDFDLSRSENRRARARRMRISGLTLMGTSVALMGAMLLVGRADDHCDHETDTWVCIDGIKLWGITGAYLAAPMLATGTALTTAGYVIERRERRRVSVNGTASGVRLSF